MRNKVMVKNKVRLLLLVFLIALFFAFSVFLFHQKANHQYQETRQTNSDVYSCVDNFDNDKFMNRFFTEDETLKALKNFVDDLERSPNFSYRSIYKNPLDILYDAQIPDSCYAYGDKSIEILSDQKILHIKSLEINSTAAEYFDLNLPSILFDNTEILPVLVGSNYANTFQEGDIFALDYFGIPFSAYIQEILPQGTQITRRQTSIILDDYIIVPFIDCPQAPNTDAEKTFQVISYTSRANGDALLTDDYSFEDLQQELNNLTQRYNLPEMGYLRKDRNGK